MVKAEANGVGGEPDNKHHPSSDFSPVAGQDGHVYSRCLLSARVFCAFRAAPVARIQKNKVASVLLSTVCVSESTIQQSPSRWMTHRLLTLEPWPGLRNTTDRDNMSKIDICKFQFRPQNIKRFSYKTHKNVTC